MRRTIINSALLLMLALPAAASWKHSAMFESEDVRDVTETRVFTHKLSSDWAGVRVDVRLTLSEGGGTVTLRDTEGKIRFEKTFEKGDASIRQQLEGKAGEWRIDLRLKNATGRYTVKLVGV